MKNKETIEKTLNSLEGLQPATAGEDFYDKLKQRLAKSSDHVINLRKDFRWQAVAAAILLLLTTNITVMLNYDSSAINSTASEVLVKEYDLIPETGYEYFTNFEEN